jgi:hypothetical protein
METRLHPALRVYVFLIGFGWVIDVGIIGRFALAEILLYLALPFLLANNRVQIWNRTAKTFFCLIVLFAVGVVISDVITGNFLAFFLRGFARPIAIGLNTLCLTLIIARSPRLMLDFALGMLPGACVGYFQESQFHDFGVAGGYKDFNAKIEPIFRAGVIISGIFLYRYHRLLAAFVMMLPGFIVVIYGSRSGAAFYFMAAITIGFIWLLKGRERRAIHMGAKFLTMTVLALVSVVSFAYLTYIYAAPEGLLGERQQVKFYEQSTTRFGVSPLGLVFSGRTEVVAGLIAAINNPVVGLGSWPNIGEYAVDAVDIAGETLSDVQYASAFLQRAAGHSIIIGSWFNNGIFALAFWVYFCILLFRVFLLQIRRDNLLTPMVVYIFFELSWHLLFSPLGPKSRLYVAIFAALAICLTDKRGPLVSEREFALLSPFSKLFKKNTFFR